MTYAFTYTLQEDIPYNLQISINDKIDDMLRTMRFNNKINDLYIFDSAMYLGTITSLALQLQKGCAAFKGHLKQARLFEVKSNYDIVSYL